jgi:WD40 repeat protein
MVSGKVSVMRALRLSFALFALFITTFGIADAQAEPLRIGGTLPGEIAWSPDGAHLLVAASDMTRHYRTGEWDAPLRTFPAALRATWVNMRVIELDGQRYEVRTGRAVETPDAVPQNPTKPMYNRLDYPSQKYTTARVSDITLELTDIQNPDASVIELPVNDNGTVLLTIFSPDSAKLAVLYQDLSDTRKRLQLWDIGSQKRLFEVRATYSSTFYEVRFSEDSLSLLAFETVEGDYGPYGGVPSNEFINIWDTATGERTYRSNGTYSLPEFGADGWLAYITDSDFSIPELTVWNGSELIHTGFTPAADAYFTEDGRMLFAVSHDNVGVFNLDFDQRTVEQAGTTSSFSEQIAFSDDGDILLTKESYNSPKFTLWHTEPLTLIASFEADQPLSGVKFSPDNSLFALERKTFWDSSTGEKMREFSTPVQIAPDWSWVSYWDGGELVFHGLNDGAEVREALVEPEIGTATTVDPLERWAFFWKNETLTAYRLSDGKQSFTLPAVRAGQIIFAADGSFIAVPDGIDQYSQGRRLHNVSGQTINPVGETVTSEISQDGEISATYEPEYYQTSNVTWRDVDTKEIIGAWIVPFGDIQQVEFHPTENWLAVDVARRHVWSRSLLAFHPQSEVYIIDVRETNNQSQTAVIKLTFIHEGERFSNPVFSPAGRFLVLSCSTNCVDIIDLHDLPESGSLMQPVSKTFGASALAYDEPESMVFVKDSRKDEASLYIWDTDQEPLIFPAVGKSIALNADGTLAATVTADGIALWDVNAVRAGDLAPLAVYPITGLTPTQLTFDAANRLIALESSGVTVYEPLEVRR